MTPYDATMAGLLVAGLIWGAGRGLARQAASLGSLVLGYAAAQGFSAQLAPYMPGSALVAKAAAMVVLYVAVSGAIHWAAWSARSALRKMKFEAYDRHLGMILGGVEGGCLGVIGTLFAVGLFPSARGPILNSPSGRVVSAVWKTGQGVLPVEYRRMLADSWTAGDSPKPSPAAVSSSPASFEFRPESKPAPLVADESRLPAIVQDPVRQESLANEIRGGIKNALKREESRLKREAKREIERRLERLGGRDEPTDTTPRR